MKLVMGCFASLLAFALFAPAAHAGWPPKPRDRTPPTAPTNLRFVSATDDSITLRWNPSTDNSGSIHHYIVFPTGLWHPGDSTTMTLTSLVPSYTQTYTVVAVDATGNQSAPSAPLTASTAPDVTAPTTPANLRLTAINSPSSLTLAWDRSSDRWSFSYEIVGGNHVIAGAGGTSTRLRHLTPGATYTFTVRAKDNAGNVSGASNALTVTLPPSGDMTAPTAPANLTAEDLADFCGSIILRWGQSTDNADPPSALEYEIFRNGFFFELVTGTGSAFVYSPSGTSTWTVKAVDRSGNTSNASNAATVTVVADENLC